MYQIAEVIVRFATITTIQLECVVTWFYYLFWSLCIQDYSHIFPRFAGPALQLRYFTSWLDVYKININYAVVQCL